MRTYAKPNSGQQTSTRINQLLRTRLAEGDTVTLWLLTDVTLTPGPAEADLTAKAVRVLVEHAALVELADAGFQVHNL